MNAEVAPKLPYNGAMMRWARKWRGRTIAEAAHKVGVPIEKIEAWEAGEDIPSVPKARKLADFYGRAFLEFFYDHEPEIKESGLVPDYRIHRGASDPRANREILEIQHWAEMQRINALDLYEDVEEPPPSFPKALHASLEDSVEEYAEQARAALSFSFAAQRQMTYRERQDLPNVLRAKMEDVGVLVLRENALSKFGVSGMTIVQFPLPIIVYAAEAPARSAFTLMHEFGHIVLRESAISGPQRVQGGVTHERRVERWCDKFAAAFLIPKSALEDLRGPPPAKPVKAIDDTALAAIAKHFKVSQHALLIRLVDLEYIEAEYYWGVKRPQFLAEEAKWKSRGIPRIWASRIWNQLGNLYTGLVLEALGTGKIQPHQAQTLFGVSNPTHLTTIRQEFGGA
ncbi:MAG: ImmA/IrrE family metallo-endopeptidase [Sphingomonas sp.]|nr:ImmA/IrrE family metallo-endopeptidase [Sphingomonas sp.]